MITKKNLANIAMDSDTEVEERDSDDTLTIEVSNEYTEKEPVMDEDIGSSVSSSDRSKVDDYILEGLCDSYNCLFDCNMQKFHNIKAAFKAFSKKFRENYKNFDIVEHELRINDVDNESIDKLQKIHRLSSSKGEIKPTRIERHVKKYHWNLRCEGTVRMYTEENSPLVTIYRDDSKLHFIEIDLDRLNDFKCTLTMLCNGKITCRRGITICNVFSYKKLSPQLFQILRKQRFYTDFDSSTARLFAFEPMNRYKNRVLCSLIPVHGKPFEPEVFKNFKDSSKSIDEMRASH